jgi:hypothetical protein
LEDPRGLKYSAQWQSGSLDIGDLPGGKILVVFYSPQEKNGKPGFYLAANTLARTSGSGSWR